MSVYDPTVGSGGMLIQSRDYIREHGENPREVALYGQENKGTTWSICKMNMLLHGISHADIRQADTLREPQHLDESNELKRFDRVLANPPFSQNYIKKDIQFPGRFAVWLPEKGKKADLMFVQHMLSVLKADGKLATIMPHGVLFRGGEEAEARKYFIDKKYLEAIIGLPANLFYGTGIPACIFVLNKQGAADRTHCLIINADREYHEGKAQNFLRPEDVDKIVEAYRRNEDIPAYARRVPYSEIEGEDYNCNIRRYVDNSPHPEPHDVHAHLHGGIPNVEVESLEHFWSNYEGLKEGCFRSRDEVYSDLTDHIVEKRSIPGFISDHSGVVSRHKSFMEQLEKWWQNNLPIIEALAPDPANQSEYAGNVYAMRRQLLKSIAEKFCTQHLLNRFQIRGAFANYINVLKADFKSIAASGWGPELIPDEDILKSQFPELLEEIDSAQFRLAELQALFTAADEEDFEDTDDTGVLSSQEVKRLKEEQKEKNIEWKEHLKNMRAVISDLYTEMKAAGRVENGNKKSYYCAEGLTQSEALFENGYRIIELAESAQHNSAYIDIIKELIENGNFAKQHSKSIALNLARHKALEEEAKELKQKIKTISDKRDELVEQARTKISEDEARSIIIDRLGKILRNTYINYLRADLCSCIAAIENLWNKYAITAKQIEEERNNASEKLKNFLVELGYE